MNQDERDLSQDEQDARDLGMGKLDTPEELQAAEENVRVLRSHMILEGNKLNPIAMAHFHIALSALLTAASHLQLARDAQRKGGS